MSLDGQYDRDNVFAKIIRGEMPAIKLWEDDEVLAFMDVFPQSRGHALVISKTSTARNLLEVEPEVLSRLALTTQRVARAVREGLGADGVTVMQFNGAAGGQTVYHLHFHVIPRWDGEPLKSHGGAMADLGELKALAERISEKL
jgi:histidine triad (HIT) family protein